MRVVQVNYAFDERLRDGDALLTRYTTLTGWSEALLHAGVDEVQVVQRFHRDERWTRNGVDYVMCRDGPWRPSSLMWAGTRIAKAVRALQPTVVHVNGLGFAWPTWVLTRRLPAGSICVVQHHGGGVPRPPATIRQRVKNSLRHRLLASVDAFLFSTLPQAGLWRRAGLIAPRQAVHAVMEASSTLQPVDRAAAQSATGLTGTPAVLWVGRLNANKDPLTVLAAFERILTELPDAHLSMIYSDAELLPAVTERIHASERLARAVRLRGAVPHDQLAAFYSAADLFVLGSHHEGSGYALLEACACGCVPVVTDIPSFLAITDGGALGTNWAPGSASQCARALLAAASLDLAQARRSVREHFERELSWFAVGRRAKRAYEAVIEDKRSRRL